MDEMRVKVTFYPGRFSVVSYMTSLKEYKLFKQSVRAVQDEVQELSAATLRVLGEDVVGVFIPRAYYRRGWKVEPVVQATA